MVWPYGSRWTGFLLKPWPNGPPNTSQVHNIDGVAYRLATTCLELDQVGLNLIKLKFSPNSSPIFHLLATSASSSQLSPSCLLSLRDYTVVQYSDNWMTWQYCLATCWCKSRFCNLARVGLSWEYCLARARAGHVFTYIIVWVMQANKFVVGNNTFHNQVVFIGIVTQPHPLPRTQIHVVAVLVTPHKFNRKPHH